MQWTRRGGRKPPKHVAHLIDEMREMDEAEMEKYAENAKREMIEWIDTRIIEAIELNITIEECCATLLGIVLQKSYEPFAALPPVDIADPEWEANFYRFSHAQGHKMIELYSYIIMTYIDKLPEAEGT